MTLALVLVGYSLGAIFFFGWGLYMVRRSAAAFVGLPVSPLTAYAAVVVFALAWPISAPALAFDMKLERGRRG
jgi:hypothetical protein